MTENNDCIAIAAVLGKNVLMIEDVKQTIVFNIQRRLLLLCVL